MPFCSTAVSALRLDLVVVDELRRLLVGQRLHRLRDGHLAQLAPRAAHLLEHALELARQILHARRRHDLHLRRQQRHLDLDLLVVELALAQHLAEFLARGRVGRLHVVEIHLARRRQQHVEDALLGRVGGAVAHLARLRFARLLDRRLDQVADDRVDVAADVAHLGELGRLDLDERRVGEARQAARDFGLADAGRADHQDVLRRDLLAQRLGHLLPPPAVAQRDRDGALRVVLPDDVLVELGDDFSGVICDMAARSGMTAMAGGALYRERSRRAVRASAVRTRIAYHDANWPARRHRFGFMRRRRAAVESGHRTLPRIMTSNFASDLAASAPCSPRCWPCRCLPHAARPAMPARRRRPKPKRSVRGGALIADRRIEPDRRRDAGRVRRRRADAGELQRPRTGAATAS